MKACWLVALLAILIIVSCLAGPKPSYDTIPAQGVDPLRSARAVIMRPFLQAAAALDATADW